VLVSRAHPAADALEVPLSELASSEFLCPAADLTPRFHEVLIGMCQGAGFDPIISRHSPVSGCETDLVLDKDSVTLVAESFVPVTADRVVAVPLTPPSYQDTSVSWRTDEPPEPALGFAEVAATVFRETLVEADSPGVLGGALARG
jgi:hypothetical protein